MRVLGSLRQKVHDRLKAVVGVVQQDVALAHMVKNIGLRFERDDRAGREALVAQLGTVDLHRERHEAGEIQRTVDPEDVLLLEVENVEQAREDMFRAVFFDLEPDRGASLNLAQFFLDRMEQVARFLLVHIEVAVPCDAEEVGTLHGDATEKRLHMILDNVAEENIVVAIRLRGEWHEARQDAWRLHDGDVGAEALTLEFHNDIEAFVQQLRERVRGVHRQRREDRIDGLEVELFKVRTLGGGNGGVVVKADAVGLEGGCEGFPPAAVLIIHHAAHAGADAREGLRGGKPVRSGFRGIVLPLLFEAGDADLEKFIQVRTDDAEKFEAFE